MNGLQNALKSRIATMSMIKNLADEMVNRADFAAAMEELNQRITRLESPMDVPDSVPETANPAEAPAEAAAETPAKAAAKTKASRQAKPEPAAQEK